MIRIIIFLALLALGFTAWLIVTSPQQLKAVFNQYSTAEEVVVDANQQNITEQPEINASKSEEHDTKPGIVEVGSERNTEQEEGTAKKDQDAHDIAVESLSKDEKSNNERPAGTNTQIEPLLAESSPSNPIDKNSKATKSQSLPQSHHAMPAWGQFGMHNPMANTQYMNMMNPMMSMMNPMMSMMNPMMSMMNPMMSMMSMMGMGPMMNPAAYMNPMAMMQHPINSMTQPQMMNSMMLSMDPNLMFSMFGQPSAAYKNGEVPDQLPVVTIPGFPTQTYQHWPRNKVSPGVSREAKKNAFQVAMAFSPLSMRDMLGIMTDKLPVAEDVTWDDAVEAMKSRANEVNFKFVGSSPLWKEIEAVTGKPSAKVEMFRFCDAEVARNILDEVPEFIVFLPCKIALIEDGEGKLWVMTLDWDVSWLDFAQNPNNHLAKDIRVDAKRIRESLQYIMEGAATGDF